MKIYKTCDIPLQNFLQVTGLLRKMKEGIKVNNPFVYLYKTDDYDQDLPITDELAEAWESIVSEYEEMDTVPEMKMNFRTSKSINYLKWKRVEIQPMIWHILLAPEDEHSQTMIEELKKQGYVIDTSSEINFLKSIQAAYRKWKNLTNQINIRASEIKLDKGEDKEVGYDEIVVWLQESLAPATISEDNLTLRRFVEYKKRIKRKEKHYEQINNKRRARNR